MATESKDYFGDLQRIYLLTGFSLYKKRTFLSTIWTVIAFAVIWLPPLQLFLQAILSDSIFTTTESLVTGIAIFNSATKLLSIFIQEERVIAIFADLKERIMQQMNCSWKREILEQGRMRVENIQKMFLINFSICVAAALINSAAARFLNPEGGLPLREWFPFDIHTTNGFIAGFIYQVFTTSGAIIIFTFGYMTFCALVIHATSQIKILEMEVRKLNTSEDNVMQEEEIKYKLIKIVKHHLFIVRLVDDTNKIFGEILLLEIVLSSVQSCLVVFQCSERSLSDPKQLFFIPFVLCTTIMPASICWCGELLKTQAKEFSEAVYDCGWYTMSPKLRRELLFVLRQSCQPLMLRVRNTFNLDMQTFLKALQSAYSYFAMLSTVDN